MHEARSAITSDHPSTPFARSRRLSPILKEPCDRSRLTVLSFRFKKRSVPVSTHSMRSLGSGADRSDDFTRPAAEEAERRFQRALERPDGPAGSFLTDYLILLAEFQELDEALQTLKIVTRSLAPLTVRWRRH